MNQHNKVTLLAIIVLVLLLWIMTGVESQHNKIENGLTINGVSFDIELAQTPARQMQGLSGRASLADDSGLLFVYQKPAYRSFWMKDMHFAIDIIWIDASWQIIDISPSLDPKSFPATFTPKAPAQYVLEVNTDLAEKHGFKAGDQVSVSPALAETVGN